MAASVVSAYSNHAFRVFFSPWRESVVRPADKANVTACEAALSGLSDSDREKLEMVFTSDLKSINQAVKAVSAETGVPEIRLWQLIRKATRGFAAARGL